MIYSISMITLRLRWFLCLLTSLWLLQDLVQFWKRFVKCGFCFNSQSYVFIIVLYHFFLGGCRQISQAFYQLPFTIYACMQELCVCYFWMVFKKIFGIVLYFLLIALFGSVNRLPHYLVSLTLSILFVYLKQVMDNNYYLEAGSICLRVKIKLIFWLE